MTKTDFFSNNDEWFTAQQKMWDEWCTFATKAFGDAWSGNTPSNANQTLDWEALNRYWSSLYANDTTPPVAKDFCKRLIDASKVYFDLAEHSTKLSEEGLNMHQLATDWADRLSKTFGQTAGLSAGEAGGDAVRDLMAFWDLPQDTLQRTMSSLFPFPGDTFRALRPEGIKRMPGDIHGRLDHFLSIPAVGYTRESQEKYQKLGRLSLDYQKVFHDYVVAISKVNLEAVELFQKRLHHLAEEGSEINSIKDIYNLWVDACEEAYAEYAMSEGYTKLYGELVNSLMGVKRQTAKIVDEYFESLNMPTRKEINTLHERVQSIRRDYNTLRADHLDELEQEMEKLIPLKDELQAFKASMKEAAGQKEELKALRAELKSLQGQKEEIAALKTQVKTLQEQLKRTSQPHISAPKRATKPPIPSNPKPNN
jgi:class III poly(R)-hydroxyalkanoic acid synthase PhaE subunit